jgi:hypothetical protein
MQQRDIADWEHDHVFDRGNAAGERGTRAVAWLTALMMVVGARGDCSQHHRSEPRVNHVDKGIARVGCRHS